MKKLLLILFVLIGYTSAYAQKVDTSKVPDAVEAALLKKYPKATIVKWVKDSQSFRANFKDGSKIKSALYDTKGKLLEYEATVTGSDLPEAVEAGFKAKYPGEAMKSAARVTKGSTYTFKITMSGKKATFDGTGKFLKEQKI